MVGRLVPIQVKTCSSPKLLSPRVEQQKGKLFILVVLNNPKFFVEVIPKIQYQGLGLYLFLSVGFWGIPGDVLQPVSFLSASYFRFYFFPCNFSIGEIGSFILSFLLFFLPIFKVFFLFFKSSINT